MGNDQISQYAYTLLILFGAGIMYQRYQQKYNVDSDSYNYKLLQEYLLNDNSNNLGKSKKPVLWIHIPYEVNSRIWENFNSRNNKNLNIPYFYLTIKSIIENCSQSFNICLIDDNSFSKLLNDWNIDFNKLAEPVKNKVRHLCFFKILYKYGGFFVPPSFVCNKNLKSLYDEGIVNNKPFVFEFYNNRNTFNISEFFPNINMIGAPKKNDSILNCIHYLENMISKDFTNESVFLDNTNRFIYQEIINNKINYLEGTKIGTKTYDNKPIVLEELFNKNTNFSLPSHSYGIAIPHEELIKRHKYNWFVYLDVDAICDCDNFLCNLIKENI